MSEDPAPYRTREDDFYEAPYPPNEPASFGSFVRQRREFILKRRTNYTVRKFAEQLGIQPSYISKIERNEVPPPSEATIVRMAKLLGVDPDLLLAMAGKVSADLRQAIIKRPRHFADLIRHLRDASDNTLEHMVREAQATQYHAGNESGESP